MGYVDIVHHDREIMNQACISALPQYNEHILTLTRSSPSLPSVPSSLLLGLCACVTARPEERDMYVVLLPQTP